MELEFGTGSTLVDLPFFKVSERDLLRLTNSPTSWFDRVRQPAWTLQPWCVHISIPTKGPNCCSVLSSI